MPFQLNQSLGHENNSYLMLVLLTPDMPTFANCVDLDQLKKPTDLDLHSLSFSI